MLGKIPPWTGATTTVKYPLIHVIETTLETGTGSVVVKPVGLAVWNVSVLTKATGMDPAEKERRDADKKRCEAFFGKGGQRSKIYFAKWASQQVKLATLVVHPGFRLPGGGTMLVRWGMAVAENNGWPVILCASPMGRVLYKHLGFEEIASEVVQVEGEEETLTSTVMVWGAGE
ncbi:hypothetical protein BJ875DRAFT_500994 [Amylocarpus encephaloides]|uniref:N-acetyltransferase domain-containing protein n=1 Tax=Amylocarpus encephaloides TaxID=45428 RepID=A0A9P8BZ19_9HELO|nr:hypothetical protein BJ875DRAFT_500994 [Amylocarpus encephaloides]